MPTHRVWDIAGALGAGLGGTRPALLALAAALALALAGRAWRKPWLVAVAPALALLLGWGALASGASVLARLPFLPGAALLAAGLARALGPRRGPAVAAIVLAGIAAWWLAGAPHDFGSLRAALPALAATAALAGGLWRGIRGGVTTACAEAAVLVATLILGGVGGSGLQAALVAWAACAVLAGRPAGVAAVLILHVGVLGAAAAALLGAAGAGLAGHAAAAAFAPAVVAWLGPWLAAQVRRGGQALPLALAGAAAIAIAWITGSALARM